MPFRSEKDSATWRITPDLLGVTDASGYFTQTNPAWFKTLGYRASEVETRPFMDFVHEEDVARTEKAFHDLQRGMPVLKFRNRYRHREGHYRWLSWNCVPEGDVFFCTARDITAEKEREDALLSREQEAALREQFIAVLGHDLRNPIAATGAAVRMARREVDSEKAHELLDMATQSLGSMSRLVNHVMDFARARLGGGINVDITKERPLRPGLEQVLDEIRLANGEHEIEADFSFSDPVRCDPDRVAQLFSNLLANAVTHGVRDVPIRVRAQDVAGEFVLSVGNAGEPIPEEALPKLFEPFKRSEVRESREGLGLGLFIAHEIALRHDGEIEVRSDADWTEFTFRMPRRD